MRAALPALVAIAPPRKSVIASTLTERELLTISGGNTLGQVPGTPMPEINRNLK